MTLTASAQMVDDIRSYLLAEGLEDVYCRLMPDDPDDLIALMQTSGQPSDMALPINYPGLQILVRNRDVWKGDKAASEVHDALINAFPVDISSTHYYRMEPLSTASFTDKEGKGPRYIHTLNFIVAKQRSLDANIDGTALLGGARVPSTEDAQVVANLLRLKIEDQGYGIPVWSYQLPDFGDMAVSVSSGGGSPSSLARPYNFPEFLVRTRARDVAVGETLAQLCHDLLHRLYFYYDQDSAKRVYTLAAQGSPQLVSKLRKGPYYEHEFRIRGMTDR